MQKTLFNSITDKELYEQCCFYGAQIRKWSRKFAALLIEVEKRELYKKYKFHSIFEFAAKIAGMNWETVRDILRVSRKLEDKPLLKAQMEKHGWGKLRVVASIATKENEKILAEKVQEMSQDALITFVREIRKQNGETVQNGIDSAQQQIILQETSPRIFLRLPLDPQTELRFRELQKKISKETKVPVDFNEVLKTLLDVYDEKTGRPILEKLEKKAREEIEEDPKDRLEVIAHEKTEHVSGSRYIPATVKKLLRERYGGRCAYPGCIKLPEINHHTRRFAINPSHNPDFLVPLCKGHERLAHLGLIENEEKPPEEWFVKMEREKTGQKYLIDKMVNKYRRFSSEEDIVSR